MWYYIRIFIGIFIAGNLFMNYVWCGSSIDIWNENVDDRLDIVTEFNYLTSQNDINLGAVYENVVQQYELEIEALELWDSKTVCFRFYYDGNYPDDYIELDIAAFDSWDILTNLFEQNITPYNQNWYQRSSNF